MTSYTQPLLLLPPSPPSSPPQAQTQPQSLRGWDNQFHGKNVVFNISFKIFPTLLSDVLKRIAHAQNSTMYVHNTTFGNNEFTQNVDHWETEVLFTGQQVCNKHL